MSNFHKKRLQDPYWWIVVAIATAIVIFLNLFVIKKT